MNSAPVSQPGQRQFLLGFVVALVAFVAVTRAGYLALQANRQGTEDLVWQAQMLAQTVNPDRLERLTGDPSAPVYQRLKRQVEALKVVYPDSRSVALVGRRADGVFFFQIDSEKPGSPEAVIPGQTIEQPPEHYRRAFDTNTVTIGRRLAILRGGVVSVAAPIRNSATGRPVALLRVFNDCSTLRGEVIEVALPPLLAGAVVIAALWTGVFLTRRRMLLVDPPRWMGYLEPACVVVAGAAMTLAFSWTSRHTEERNRDLAFRDLAISKTTAFTLGLLNLRDEALAGLASYIQSNRELTAKGFEEYARYLTRTRCVRGWKWIPAVPAEAKEQLEREVRAEGRPGYTIWQKDAMGHPVPAAGSHIFYPVLYSVPSVGNERTEGYDLGSDPRRRVALEEAARSGFPTSTDPIDLIQEGGRHRGLLVFQPVFAEGEPPRLRGFALAVLRLDYLLQSAPSDAAAFLELSFLSEGRRGERIAGQHPEASRDPCCECVLPFLVFGKPMIVTVYPGRDFERSHPRRAEWLPIVTGMFLTLIVAALVHATTRRREKLQRLVIERTSALAASEARHRAMFEKNRSIELLIDPATGEIVDANPSACAYYGYSREEMRRLNIAEINQLTPAEVHNEMQRARTESFSGFHFRHRLAGGEIRDVEVHSSPIRVENRELLYSIIHDITQRKIAEAALAESELNFRVFFETIGDLVAVVSLEGRLLCANQALVSKLGYSAEALTGMPYRDLFSREDADDADEIFAAIGRGERNHCPFPMHTRAGVLVPVETHLCSGRWKGEACFISLSKDLSAEQEAQQRFERFFRSNPAFMMIIALPEDTIVDVNDSFLKCSGYTREEIIGQTPARLNLFPRSQFRDEALEIIEKQGRLVDCEEDFRTKEGHIRRALLSAEIIHTQGRLYVLGVGTDITERKQAEIDRQTLLERFFTILSNMYSGVLLVTVDSKIEFVNSAFCEQFKCGEPGDVIGLTTREMVELIGRHYSNFGNFVARTEEIIAQNQPVRGEEIVLDGGRTFQRDYVPLTIQGRPHGRLWLHNEITERKRTEDAVIRQANLIRSLLDSIPDLIFFKDTKGMYRGCNPAFAEFAGRTRDQIVGKSDSELFGHVAATAFRHHDEQALQRNQTFHNEEWICYPDGRSRLVDTIKAPYRGPDGEVIGILGICRDITERRRAEDALRHAKEAAEAASHAKSDFLANMSHEIRTPMNAILGFAHLVQSDPDTTPLQKQHLEVITRSGNFLLSLINDILEMSRLEAGRTTLVPQPFDLHVLLQDLERIFLPQIEAKRLQYHPPDLTKLPRQVVGDEKKLRQILFNLLGNAVKFTFAGWVALRARVEETGGQNLRLHLEIEDTGVGIAQRELRHLFERFSQTQSGRRLGVGTGLGLAITRGFVEIMGGAITVSSQIRKGSTFAFHVRLEKGDGCPPFLSPAALRRRENHAPLRVLLADDREKSRSHLRKILAPLGFEIREAIHGDEALTLFKIWDPHLILMDLRMPVMDGCESARRIREALRGPDVKIVISSSSAFEEDRRKAIAAGADAFLKKPVQPQELFDIIRALFRDEFTDETDEPRPPRDPIIQSHITREGLSREWAATMRDAVEAADYHEVERLIAEIASLDPRRGEQLRLLAGQFDAPSLLGFLDSILAADA